MIEIVSLRTARELKTIVDEMIFLRKRFKMTQGDMAKALGISQPYLCKIESGISRQVPFELIVRMLDLFEIEVFLGNIKINNTPLYGPQNTQTEDIRQNEG